MFANSSQLVRWTAEEALERISQDGPVPLPPRPSPEPDNEETLIQLIDQSTGENTMPVLIYQDSENHYKEWSFSDKIRIGSDPARNDLVLPTTAGVAPQHAVIINSMLNRMRVLVDLAGQNTRVNDRPIVSIQVLHQRDVLELGKIRLTMWEIRITSISQKDPSVGKPCLVCRRPFEVGKEVITCPRCFSLYHRECWFAINPCANYTCGYPVLESIMDALSASVTFERDLAENSELVELRRSGQVIKKGKTCQARTREDQIPFQVGNDVAYCPSPACRATFHPACWLNLERCTRCDYNIRQLLDETFLAGKNNPLTAGEA